MMARPAVKKTIEIEAAVGYQLPQYTVAPAASGYGA
jgi:hypothetical protein